MRAKELIQIINSLANTVKELQGEIKIIKGAKDDNNEDELDLEQLLGNGETKTPEVKPAAKPKEPTIEEMHAAIKAEYARITKAKENTKPEATKPAEKTDINADYENLRKTYASIFQPAEKSTADAKIAAEEKALNDKYPNA